MGWGPFAYSNYSLLQLDRNGLILNRFYSKNQSDDNIGIAPITLKNWLPLTPSKWIIDTSDIVYTGWVIYASVTLYTGVIVYLK